MGHVPRPGDSPDKYRHQPGMIKSFLKKSIAVSAFCHLTVFSLFSFSFGERLVRADYPDVSFFGRILGNYGLISMPAVDTGGIKKSFFVKSNTFFLDSNRKTPAVSSYYLKPQADPVFSEHKKTMLMSVTAGFGGLPKRDSVVMFYPQLPFHFLLYFKDRQTVHIELVFNIISDTETSHIAIKRKISSGNLEADLLTMRYLSHYLFIQQAGLPSNTWQSVKIELSPKNK